MGAPAIAAILRRREQEVVDDFRAAGALSPSTAQSYHAMGLGHTLAVKRLHNRAVIREAAPGVYYLDEEVWAAVRRKFGQPCAEPAGASQLSSLPS